MLAECLNKIAYECFEFFSAYFAFDFVGLPSPVFRTYGEELFNKLDIHGFVHRYVQGETQKV
jgi:hypothetical protein